MSLPEILNKLDKMLHVISLACHQVSASHVDPFELGQPLSELFFHSVEYPGKVIGSGFTQGVKMKTLHTLRQGVEILFQNAEP